MFSKITMVVAMLAAAAAAIGCGGDLCGRHSDCAVGQYCAPGDVCAVLPDASPPADAGPDAAPRPDAGPDAAPADADTTPDAEPFEEPDAS